MPPDPQTTPPSATPPDAARVAPSAPQPATPPVRQLRRREQTPEDIKFILDAARSAVDQEFLLADRLDRKSQYPITLAAAWFTAAQVIAGGLLMAPGIPASGRIIVAVIAVATGCLLARALFATLSTWRLRGEKALKPEELDDLTDRVYRSDDAYAAGDLAKQYSLLFRERRDINEERADAVEVAQSWVAAAMGLTLVELLAAILVRLVA